ncbi:MAG: hypothetical protein KDI79_31895 [Anaerolineae bacterium]|nr:hypothetical protein [Anaerolineae bacterium]
MIITVASEAEVYVLGPNLRALNGASGPVNPPSAVKPVSYRQGPVTAEFD